MRMKEMGMVALCILAALGVAALADSPPPPEQEYRVAIEFFGEGEVYLDPAPVYPDNSEFSEDTTVWYGDPHGEGVDVKLEARPAEGYSFSHWVLKDPDGEVIDQVEGESYTTADPVVTLKLRPDDDWPSPSDWIASPVFTDGHIITASAGDGGSIIPEGTVKVPEGAGEEFLLEPDTGYRIAEVLVNGNSVGAVEHYTFEDVTSDHEIHVTFEPLTPPAVATGEASDVSVDSATLSGELVELGSASTVDVFLVYGLSSIELVDGVPETAYAETISPVPSTVDTAKVMFEATLDGVLEDDTTYYFRAVADAGEHGIVYGEEKSFTTPEAIVISVSRKLKTGWNMISLPVEPLDQAPEDVFSEVSSLNIWEWAQGEYVKPTKIEPSQGYWLYLFSETTITVEGLFIEEDYGVQLGQAGWHILSTPTTHVQWGRTTFRLGEEEKSFGAAVEAGWISPSVHQYNTGTGGYESFGGSGAIEAWFGQWIRTYVDDVEVILPIKDAISSPPPPPGGSALEATYLGDNAATPPPPPNVQLNANTLEVRAQPNPVRTDEQTTLSVRGPLAAHVEAMRIKVTDLSGRTVFQSERSGTTVHWNLADSDGQSVANGMYLCVIEVKAQGTWIQVPVYKLLILR